MLDDIVDGVLLLIVTPLVLLATLASAGCQPPYVQRPPVHDEPAPVAHPASIDPVCRWVPSGRAVRPSERICGGQPSREGAYPWACAVETFDGRQYCGASLVSPDRAVTAAHCQVAIDDVLHCGTADLRRPGVRVAVREVRNHYMWRGTVGGHDIAVLVLDDVVPVAPIELAAGVPDYPAALVAIGWGAQVAGGPTTPEQRHVQLPLVPFSVCDETYEHVLTGDMLCAGDYGTGIDTCQGDSGGPLVSATDDGWRLVGVTSWGARCTDAPGVYTSVPALIRWVRACAEVSP